MEKLNKANELAAKIEKTKREIAMYENALTATINCNQPKMKELFEQIAFWLKMPLIDAFNSLKDGLTTDLEINKENLRKYEQELENMFK